MPNAKIGRPILVFSLVETACCAKSENAEEAKSNQSSEDFYPLSKA